MSLCLCLFLCVCLVVSVCQFVCVLCGCSYFIFTQPRTSCSSMQNEQGLQSLCGCMSMCVSVGVCMCLSVFVCLCVWLSVRISIILTSHQSCGNQANLDVHFLQKPVHPTNTWIFRGQISSFSGQNYTLKMKSKLKFV